MMTMHIGAWLCAFSITRNQWMVAQECEPVNLQSRLSPPYRTMSTSLLLPVRMALAWRVGRSLRPLIWRTLLTGTCLKVTHSTTRMTTGRFAMWVKLSSVLCKEARCQRAMLYHLQCLNHIGGGICNGNCSGCVNRCVVNRLTTYCTCVHTYL